MKFDIWIFFENLSRKSKFQSNLTRITGTLREDQRTFLIISRWIILILRKFSGRNFEENKNTPFISSDRLWYDVEKYRRAGQATDDNIMLLMRTTCWIPKAENTHSEYVTFIAFPLQQWLQDRASLLRYTCSTCRVNHGPQMASACLWNSFIWTTMLIRSTVVRYALWEGFSRTFIKNPR